MKHDRNPDTTLREVAAKVGCTIRALSKYKLEGVDVYDVEAVRKHRESKRTGDVPRAGNDPDIKEEKRRLTKAQADKAELEVRRLRGELVPVAEVREDMLRIGGAVKAAMLRLENDLPPRLHGLEPGAMQVPIRESIDGILAQLSEMTSGVYAN